MQFQVVGTQSFQYDLVIGIISYNAEQEIRDQSTIPKESLPVEAFHGFLVEAEELEATVLAHLSLFQDSDTSDPSKIYRAVKDFIKTTPIAHFDAVEGKLVFAVSGRETGETVTINGLTSQGVVSDSMRAPLALS
jgi:hypothetical protein